MRKNICRVCGRYAAYKSSLKIFNNQTILSNIQVLTGLVLENVNFLPNLICIDCQTQLREAISFRNRLIVEQHELLLELSEEQLQEIPIQFRESVIDSYNKTSKNSDAESNSKIPNEPEITIEEIRFLKDNKEDGFDEDEMNKDEDFVDNDFIIDANIVKEEADSEDIETDDVVDELVEQPQFEFAEEVTENVETKDFILPNQKTDEYVVLNKISNHDNTLTQNAVKKKQKRKKNRTIYTCDECGSRIAGRTDFEIHCKRHRGDKQFACNECQDRFCTSSELKRHKRKHTGERPYACKHCDCCFSDYGAHKRHERSHTNERPYVCGTCGKGYTSNQILRNHMLIHSGILPHRCDVCNKSFRLSYNLKLHLRTKVHKIELEKYELKQQKPQEQALQIKLEMNEDSLHIEDEMC